MIFGSMWSPKYLPICHFFPPELLFLNGYLMFFFIVYQSSSRLMWKNHGWELPARRNMTSQAQLLIFMTIPRDQKLSKKSATGNSRIKVSWLKLPLKFENKSKFHIETSISVILVHHPERTKIGETYPMKKPFLWRRGKVVAIWQKETLFCNIR